MKRVSVIMGTFNGKNRIDHAIESILNQSYDNLELIICDDCSTDGSFEYLKEKYGNDKRVKLVQLEQNSGLSSALNRCIALSEGEYIARMDDDDISHADRLSKQIEFLESHNEVSWVSCNINYFDDDGVFGCSSSPQKIMTKEEVYAHGGFVHPTVVIRREALSEVNNYTVSKLTRRGQDYDLWCKLYAAGHKGLVMGEVLYDYYESRSSIKNRKIKYRIDHIRVKYAWRKKLGLPFSKNLALLHDVLALMMPPILYRWMRKRRFVENQS